MFKRRLIILAVMVLALVPLSYGRTQRFEETCATGTGAFGNCVMICCSPEWGCVMTICP